MIGTITQVFSTGDFSLWSETRGRMHMVYTTVCSVGFQEQPKVGDKVKFALTDGRVVSVRRAVERATLPAAADISARYA